MTGPTPTMLRDALAALAYQAPDMAQPHVEQIAVALLASLPGATLDDWNAYTEAYEQWYELKSDEGCPDKYLDDELQRAPRDTWRAIATQITAQEKDDRLGALMARYPAPVAARPLMTAGVLHALRGTGAV